ncbi:M56 family metallopeptidase [Fodinibius sp. Rm-B-1B1-1]|uniref:M56 family metallopeptidase n=1 Tax=Fodinibius alkaliphilus TaxID=3140241 RepID=UPI003159B92A
MIEQLWLPVIIWTLVAAPLTWALSRYESLNAIYHYHIRTALLLVLPLALLGTYLMDKINSATESTASGLTIIIQNPIPVSATSSDPSILSSLMTVQFWTGNISLIFLIGAILLLLKLLVDFTRLRAIGKELNFTSLANEQELLAILPESSSQYKNTQIAYSANTAIPYTYGWLKTKIVLPTDLKGDTESLAMAVQHELIHIKNHDFLLNSFLVSIKNLFWFHPLVNHLYASREEYREILCDSQVLATNRFSKKKYASLLFELAKQDHNQQLALSMAVSKSSLKKRIQIMSNQDHTSMNFRSSFLITLFAASLLTITISCTDMADDNITKSDVEQTQAQMSNNSSENFPLYIVNGEEWEKTEENKRKLTRLKPKYIKSVNVLKGENAENQYGNKGKNGVIKMEVNNPDKAFTDLKDEAIFPPSTPSKADDGDYYVTVKDMPELVGGLGSLQQMINYPKEASEAGAEGRVIVQFIINKDGNIENPTIVKSVHESLDEEALRVVKQADFTPGKVDGEPVRVQYSLPISFRLSTDNQDS